MKKGKKPARRNGLVEGKGPLSISDRIWIEAPLARLWQLTTKGPWLSQHFTSSTTGDLDAPGRVALEWGPTKIPVEVLKAAWEKSTTFLWKAQGVAYATRVTIGFAKKRRRVLVSVKESGWKAGAAATKSMVEHASGWAHFLGGLKAFAQFGVELRT
jgi:hypothetical protein